MEKIKVFLSILFIVHVIATAAFAAGLFYQLKVTDRTTNHLDRLGWLWLILLGATGMFQMSANPNYAGVLTIDSIWAIALLIKHVLVILLMFFMAFQTFILLPEINREIWSKEPYDSILRETTRSENRRALGLRIEIVLFILILIATGITRAS